MKRILFCLAFILILAAGIAHAQSPGNTFLRLGTVSPTVGIDSIRAGVIVSFPIIYGNRDTNSYNVSNAFIIFSDADGIPPTGVGPVRGDGTATWAHATGDGGNFRGFSPDVFGIWVDTTGFFSFGAFAGLYKFACFGCNGVGGDTLAFSGAGGVDPDGNVTLALRPRDSGVQFTMKILTKLSDHGKFICIDSTTNFPPTNKWKWPAFNIVPGYNTFPTWSGAKCFTIVDPNANSLAVSKDTLSFTTVYGQPAPPSQTFIISSSPNSVPYTVTENASWILKSPSLGNTPATITVALNVTALPIGTYFDSLVVESSNAVNSPRKVYVKLNVIPPPPTINVTPTQLFFSAVVGGANPLSKDLIIRNIAGGSVLHWTLTKSQPWLSVSPGSGTDSNTVIVSVDITGLGFGTYKDTIVVSDPAASNNPVKVPVFLQMGSNLPIIEADSQINFFVINLNELIIFSRYITIRNGGIGDLDFKVTESSDRIQFLSPDSATCPQQIQIQYKISSGFDGDQYTDTLWVTSAQAVNSPYPVVVTIRLVSNPAAIGLTPDTIKFDVFECTQGGGNVLPSQNLLVQNVGGDDPMKVNLLYSSDLFTLNKDSGVASVLFKVTAEFPDIPLGTYYDTILVVSQNAVNNPRRVIVQYNRIAGQQSPQITVNRAIWPIPYLENSGPDIISSLAISNQFGGCMLWNLVEIVPWFEPLQNSGTVPANVNVLIDAPGYTLGSYPDSIRVLVTGAVNTPVVIPVELKVWKLKCDTDWDGRVDIADVTSLIAFLYLFGSTPQPTYLVGDCDCDNMVDIADLTRLIDYLFLRGMVICGNPY